MRLLRILISLSLGLASVFSAGADVLRGLVRNTDGDPLARVSIKLKEKGAIKTFAVSSVEGNYTLRIPENIGDSAIVSFNAIGYEEMSRDLSALKTAPDVMLKKAAKQLNEIVVLPDPVTVKGDTVVYNVDALREPSDRTIEDVIKRLPGVNVTGDGTIRHNGESINRLYIGGMNMLGGDYTIASKNIAATDVNTISVYAFHQPVKALQGEEHSRSSALNLDLKKSAMLKLHGHAEAGSGKGYPGAAWRGKVFLDQISSGFQAYLDVSGDNLNSGSGTGQRSPVRLSTPFDGIFSGVGASAPSDIPSEYTGRLENWQSSLNMGGLVAEDVILRGTVSGGGEYGRNSGSESDVYRMPDGSGFANEETTRDRSRHNSTGGGLAIEINKPKFYLSDELRASGDFQRISAFSECVPSRAVAQRVRTNDFALSNEASIVVKGDRRVWQFSSDTRLHNLPLNSLEAVDDLSGREILGQTARAMSFYNAENTRLSWNLGMYSSVGLSAQLWTYYVEVNSLAAGEEITGDPSNMARGWDWNIYAAPFYKFRRNRAELTVTLPLAGHIFDFDRLPEGSARPRRFRLAFNPSIRFHMPLSRNISMNAEMSRSESAGSVRDFITRPVYTTFRTWTVPGSGRLIDSETWRFNTKWIFNWPLARFNSQVSAQYTIRKLGMTSSWEISDSETGSAWVSDRSRSDMVLASLHLSKYLDFISSSVKADLSYNYSRGSSRRNGIAVKTSSTSWSLDLYTHTLLLDARLMIEPHFIWSKSIVGMSGDDSGTSSLRSWSLHADLSFFPIRRKLEIVVRPRYSDNQLASGSYSRNFFLDANLRYILRRWEFNVDLRNLTDRRHASMSVSDGLNIYTTSAPLRGLELLARVKFSF